MGRERARICKFRSNKPEYASKKRVSCKKKFVRERRSVSASAAVKKNFGFYTVKSRARNSPTLNELRELQIFSRF
jgi:hypothetical protein